MVFEVGGNVVELGSNVRPMAVTNDADLDPRQLIAVLLRRRFWVLGMLTGVLSLAAALSLTTKPSYQSSMQLLVESNLYQGEAQRASRDSSLDSSLFTDSNLEVDYLTQLNLMQSSKLLERAVELLRPEYPDLTTGEIKDSLSLTQIEENKIVSKIVQATYTSNDPLKSQKVLQALQKVYLEYNLEQQQIRLSKGLAFIDQQLPQVRGNVTKAEQALEQFRKSQNIVDPEQQAKVLSETLNTVEQQQLQNRAQLREGQARYDGLQQQLARSPQNALLSSRLSQSVRYQSLLNEIQKTELALAQERLRFTGVSPSVKKLQEQRQQQLQLLQVEVGRVLGGNSAELGSVRERLLTEGQLGTVDLTLSSQLVDAQTTLLGLRARDQSLTQAAQRIQTELRRFPTLLAEYNRLQPEVDVRRSTLQRLLQVKQELGLEIARGGFDWQVIEAPDLGSAMGPKLELFLLMGGVAGLILGVAAAFIREGVDDAVHSSDELKKLASLPILGLTPELPHAEVGERPIGLPFRRTPALAPATTQVVYWPPFREAMDLIYKNIQLLGASELPFRSLVITSALAGEGKSTLALGLAVSAARLHQRVLLIDADLRRPSLHKLLNLPNEQGLSTLLTSDDTTPSQSSIHPSGSYIDILTSGPTPSDPAKLLSSRRMGELMTAFEQTYDLVLLDAPPVLGMVDAILAASFCSGVVMIGRIGRVTRTELTQATAMLSQLNVIGVIANGAEGPTSPYAIYGSGGREISVPTVQSAQS